MSPDDPASGDPGPLSGRPASNRPPALPPVPPDAHRAAARMFASGVTVAAASHDGRSHAITATAFCSLSLDPPLVLLAVRSAGTLCEIVRDAGHVGISILGAHQHRVGAWAGTPGRSPERAVTAVETTTSITGAPLIPGALAWFDCRLHSMAEHGDHTVLVGLVVDSWCADSRDPLIYFRGGYHVLGERLTDE